LGYFAFCGLGQGKDLLYQSTDEAFTGLYLVLAATFWVFTTWYTARLVAYNRNDLFKVAPGLLHHLPRVLAYLIFWVLWLAILAKYNPEGPGSWLVIRRPLARARGTMLKPLSQLANRQPWIDQYMNWTLLDQVEPIAPKVKKARLPDDEANALPWDYELPIFITIPSAGLCSPFF
jgi:hypothetical protein